MSGAHWWGHFEHSLQVWILTLQALCVFLQTHYNCGPNKVPLPGELRAVEVVQRVKVRQEGMLPDVKQQARWLC